MKLRPTIFLSGVSSEFASFRDAVETEVQKKDCFPLNQPSFGVDYREIVEILRARLIEADALVHIVGFRFGFEPRNRPGGKLRRSYTQMEYDIAHELGKPVYVFLSADATVRDSDEPLEDSEAIELQLAHRKTITERSDNIHYTFRNTNELCNLVAGIPLLATADFRVDIGRIDRYAPAELIGREDELKILDDAWLKVRLAEPKRPHILTLVALGGEGKTSLIAKWAAQLAYENWPGCDSAFAWSFYSQGTREKYAGSSDLFLKEAILFFGNEADKEFAASNAGAYEKGQRLAHIVSRRRALLILDGLEPLQYSPNSPTPGELKDSGIAALLKGLAPHSDGLCIVTTRYSLPNLKAYWQTTSPEIALTSLSSMAGVHLLTTLGVKGPTRELEELVEDVKGHALTLNLLGTYLRDAHGGDIRRRDLVKLEEADAQEQGGHAFRAMEAYKDALKSEGPKGDRSLAMLRLLGLFDRPVNVASLTALLQEPVIKGLTEPLLGLTGTQINLALKRLEDAKLLTLNRQTSGDLISLDAHPLLREYFARELSTQQPHTWRAAHRRMYEHLCASTPDKKEPTLEDLQPLYQAVAHGCQAGLHQEVLDSVCQQRIWRFSEVYTVRNLGIFGSDLGAIACFFAQPWNHLASAFSEDDRRFLLSSAGFCLRALGRLTEAREPMQVALETAVKQEDWSNAAIVASNLSTLDLTIGNLSKAREDAEKSVMYAERTGQKYEQIRRLATYANVLNQEGRRIDAQAKFHETEKIQGEQEQDYPLIYALMGFWYCSNLLAIPERAAWQKFLGQGVAMSSVAGSGKSPYSEALQSVFERATKTLQWYQPYQAKWRLEIALDRLTLASIRMYTAVFSPTMWKEDLDLEISVDSAVSGLRQAANLQYFPHGLLARAWLRLLNGRGTGPDSAQEDLDEAWEIAERGPMMLYMADIHLYRARLFFREKEYPWESPEADLAAARKLIEQCGYWRRKEELEDAERVILKRSV